MASTLKPPHPCTTKPPKIPNLIMNSCTNNSNPPNPNSIQPETSVSPTAAAAAAAAAADASFNPLDPSPELLALSRASHLTRAEVLRVRAHRLKQLARCYRDHYWAYMEELKVLYREYYWEYGVSPLREAQHEGDVEVRDTHLADIEGSGENGNQHPSNAGINSGTVSNRIDLDATSNNQRCAFVGCKLKAMALTSFCHYHILSDPKQKLYRNCSHVIKSAQAGPITCTKTIMRSTRPSLCGNHLQKAHKEVTKAMRKAGLNVSLSTKLGPKFHIMVVECVRQIQEKRRAAAAAAASKLLQVKQEAAT